MDTPFTPDFWHQLAIDMVIVTIVIAVFIWGLSLARKWSTGGTFLGIMINAMTICIVLMYLDLYHRDFPIAIAISAGWCVLYATMTWLIFDRWGVATGVFGFFTPRQVEEMRRLAAVKETS